MGNAGKKGRISARRRILRRFLNIMRVTGIRSHVERG